MLCVRLLWQLRWFAFIWADVHGAKSVAGSSSELAGGSRAWDTDPLPMAGAGRRLDRAAVRVGQCGLLW